MAEFALHVSELKAAIPELSVGSRVYLTGTVYTARDEAHQALFDLLDAGEPLPFDVNGAVIYYAGPTRGKPGTVFGACGPTTSGRMDKFTPRLLDLGLTAMIGKGNRSPEVVLSMIKNGAVYFCAVGGTGALIAKCIKAAREVAFPEFGTESVKELTVERMPLIVGIDAEGRNIYEEGVKKYKR